MSGSLIGSLSQLYPAHLTLSIGLREGGACDFWDAGRYRKGEGSTLGRSREKYWLTAHCGRSMLIRMSQCNLTKPDINLNRNNLV